MKRWAVLTVAIYALALLLLTIPAILASFRWGAEGGPGVKDAAEIGLTGSGWPCWSPDKSCCSSCPLTFPNADCRHAAN